MKILLPLAALAALAGCVSVVPYGSGGAASPVPAAQAPVVPPTIVAKPAVKAPKDRWGKAELATRQDLVAVSAPSGLVAIAGGKKGALARTADGGLTWEILPPPAGGADDLLDVAFLDARTGWALGGKALYLTADGGATWTTQDLFADLDPYGRPETGSIALVDYQKGAFVARGHVFTTTDGGATFTKVFAPAAVAGSLLHPLQTEAKLVAMGDGYGMWNGGSLYRLAAGVPRPDAPIEDGMTVPPAWGPAPELVTGFPERMAPLAVAFPTPAEGWAILVGSGQQLVGRSRDGGRTWTTAPLRSALADGAHPSLGFPVRSGDLHVAGGLAVLLGRSASGDLVMAESKDAGASWVVSAAVDNSRIVDLAIPDATHGYAVGPGGLAWTVTSN